MREAGPGFHSLTSEWDVGGPLPLSRTPSPALLSRQLIFPDLVEGLVLMNIDPNGKGWIDWAATKVSAAPLAGGGRGQG